MGSTDSGSLEDAEGAQSEGAHHHQEDQLFPLRSSMAVTPYRRITSAFVTGIIRVGSGLLLPDGPEDAAGKAGRSLDPLHPFRGADDGLELPIFLALVLVLEDLHLEDPRLVPGALVVDPLVNDLPFLFHDRLPPDPS